MIIVLKPETSKKEIADLTEKIKAKGLKAVLFEGEERTVVHVMGNTGKETVNDWDSIQCVENTVRIMKPYKLASKEHHREKTAVAVGDVRIGNGDFVVIAGPCSVESETQIMKAA